MSAPELTIGQVMARRFQLVDELDRRAAAFKAETQPLNDELRLCEQFIKQTMLEQGQQNVKIATGEMAFFAEKTSARVEDPEQFMAAVREQGLWQLLTNNVNKTAVKEYIEEHKTPPPGVKFESYRDLNWRRS